jgi:hypothetical protein
LEAARLARVRSGGQGLSRPRAEPKKKEPVPKDRLPLFLMSRRSGTFTYQPEPGP